MRNTFRCVNSSPEVIRRTVLMYVRYPLSLRQVEICWSNVASTLSRDGAVLVKPARSDVAAAIRKRFGFQTDHCRTGVGTWTGCLSGSMARRYYLWRAADHEGEVLEVFVTTLRDRKAALKLLKRGLKRYGRPVCIVTD